MHKGVKAGFKYAEDVASGKIVCGRYIKQMVKRFYKDLKKFDFKEEEAEKAIRFTEMLRFSKGRKAGQLITWTPWQYFAMLNIFGFHHKRTGRRRFRYFYIEVGRKNGKSTFLAAIALCFLILFDEAVPELYVGASVKKQAFPVFGEMARMVKRLRKDFKQLEPEFAVFKESIEFMRNEGLVTVVASTADNLDGLNPFCTILDEVHAQKDSSLFNVFKSGTGARDNNTPIIAMVTTAGFSLVSFAYMIRKNFLQVLDGSKRDDDTFIMIYTIDTADDYNNPKVWIKSNPSMGESVSLDYLKSEYRQAQNFSSELNNFLTKNLNCWVGGVQTWIDRQMLDNNDGTSLNEQEMDEGRVYLGVDLGMVSDLSALAQVTIFADERIHVKMRYYLSKAAYHRFIAQGIPMDTWIDEGVSININEGKVTDTRMVRDDIVDCVENLEVERIGFDRWSTHQLLTQLDEQGIEVEPIGQGYRTHNECVDFVERAMAEERFVIEGDECLKWMFGNVVLDQDPAGQRKLNKKKADSKIDGISALFNALYCYIQVDGGIEHEVYGLRTLRIR
jgi:phage terminase large subunit-like protein